MKKYYSLICALLLAQGAMAIDYDQLKKSSKINAASKIELSKPVSYTHLTLPTILLV